MVRSAVILYVVGASAACAPTDTPEDGTEGVAALGGGTHAPLAPVTFGTRRDGLREPRDLAFNPERPGELWVVNHKNDGVTVYFDVDDPENRSRAYEDPANEHFLDGVSSIAFGAPGTFATAQDSTNTYNGQAPPNDFMGPALWSSDLDVFATSNPDAIDYVGFDLGSHLDMLHESPMSIGIAWEKHNVYWVFDGYNQAIARYDFREDHGVGYDDHSDGRIDKWLTGEVKRRDATPSHLAFDPDTKLLYAADTGNNRILAIDTTSGKAGGDLPVMEPGTEHRTWLDATWSVLVEGDAFGMEAPSGLELVDGLLLVTDTVTGEIHAFDLDGTQVDWAPTGLPSGSLTGITARGLDELWFVDQQDNVLYQLTP